MTDFDECADGIGCYSIYLLPFGDESGDVLSGLIEDGSISIQLNTDFVFHSTNYRTVFVSLKLVTCFLVLLYIKDLGLAKSILYTLFNSQGPLFCMWVCLSVCVCVSVSCVFVYVFMSVCMCVCISVVCVCM